MSVTSGFFNSLNGDRRYNAEQLTAIFDGIINDGVFGNIGEAFFVRSSTGNKITVSVGRAWFNSVWIYNDAVISLTAEDPEVLLDRYDAVVIEVNHKESVRNASIKIVKGTPSSQPVHPKMVSDGQVYQHPLAYIRRNAGSTLITQSDIAYVVGTSVCPFVTGILQVQNIDNIVAQWMAEWDELTNAKEEEFDAWFANIKAILDDDVATQLINRVTKIEDGTAVVGKALCDSDGTEIHVNRIQSTSRAMLSQVGWYRVAEYVGASDISAQGSMANSCTLIIRKGYNDGFPEYYKIAFESNYNTKRFKILEALSYSSKYFTKVRYVYVGTTAYLEVYYSSSGRNAGSFTITDGEDYYFNWRAITPTLTQETVEGVTVSATYDIPANASPVTDLDLLPFRGEWITTPICEKALTLAEGEYSFRFAGSYDTSDLPASSYLLSPVSVKVRYKANHITIILWGRNGYNTAKKHYNGIEWTDWIFDATKDDLANYVPLAGGRMNQGQSIRYRLATNTMNAIGSWFENPDGSDAGGICALGRDGVLKGLYMTVSPYHYDASKGLFITTDKVTWKNNDILHTGNMADHVLPLDGGGRVKANNATPLELQSLTSDNSCVIPFFNKDGTKLGELGMVENKPKARVGTNAYVDLLHTGNMADHVVTRNGENVINGGLEIQKNDDILFSVKNTKSDSTTSLIGYTDGKGTISAMGFSNGKPWVSGKGEIHHDGNSAKVAIQQSAPSDTSALWVY